MELRRAKPLSKQDICRIKLWNLKGDLIEKFRNIVSREYWTIKEQDGWINDIESSSVIYKYMTKHIRKMVRKS